jgi:hypothetical protein
MPALASFEGDNAAKRLPSSGCKGELTMAFMKKLLICLAWWPPILPVILQLSGVKTPSTSVRSAQNAPLGGS